MTHDTLSNDTTVWYCRLHFDCSDGFLGAQIVEASKDYRHLTREEYDRQHAEAAKGFCKDMGLETIDQMRDFVKARIGSIGRGK